MRALAIWSAFAAAVIIVLSLTTCTKAHAGSPQEDRMLLGGLYAMEAVCGIENGTSAKWVGQQLTIISMKRGWSMEQMTAIGAEEGQPIIDGWMKTGGIAKIQRAKANYCAKMRELKRATDAVFQ